jgi:hypothetical protein
MEARGQCTLWTNAARARPFSASSIATSWPRPALWGRRDGHGRPGALGHERESYSAKRALVERGRHLPGVPEELR